MDISRIFPTTGLITSEYNGDFPLASEYNGYFPTQMAGAIHHFQTDPNGCKWVLISLIFWFKNGHMGGLNEIPENGNGERRELTSS